MSSVTALRSESEVEFNRKRLEVESHGFECTKTPRDQWTPERWYILRVMDWASVSGPFEDAWKAFDSLPDVLRVDVLSKEARAKGYRDTYSARDRTWHVVKQKPNIEGSTHLAGPFKTQEAALAVVSELIREEREREKSSRQAREKYQLASIGIPPSNADISLDQLSQSKSSTVRDAVEIARDYVTSLEGFFKEPAVGLVFAGPVHAGKTRLACALASAAARTDFATRHDSDFSIRYATVEQLSRAEREPEGISRFLEPRLLVLDWEGIETTIEDKAVQLMAHRFAVDVARRVASLLDARPPRNPVLLLADCELDRLRELMGSETFSTLQKRSWKIVSLKA
jgi:DNA replication protein DnaC